MKVRAFTRKEDDDTVFLKLTDVEGGVAVDVVDGAGDWITRICRIGPKGLYRYESMRTHIGFPVADRTGRILFEIE